MTDLIGVIQNVANTVPFFLILVGMFCYTAGFIFIMVALNGFKNKSANAHNGSWATPFWSFVFGCLLIAIPQLMATLTQTFFAADTPAAEAIFSYAPNTIGTMESDPAFKTTITAITRIVQFVGVIGLVRGIFLLNNAAKFGGGQSTFGNGVTFALAGIAAINFPLVVGLFETLLLPPEAAVVTPGPSPSPAPAG